MVLQPPGISGTAAVTGDPGDDRHFTVLRYKDTTPKSRDPVVPESAPFLEKPVPFLCFLLPHPENPGPFVDTKFPCRCHHPFCSLPHCSALLGLADCLTVPLKNKFLLCLFFLLLQETKPEPTCPSYNSKRYFCYLTPLRLQPEVTWGSSRQLT